MSYCEKKGSDGRKRLWLEEEIQEDLKWCVEVKHILHSGKSDFQTMELIQSGPFGKVLLLDGKVQSAEADEFVYHEMLVHPAMLAHSNPKRIFICGGGEGATAREVLRHKSVEEVIMVDIDKDVCDFCHQHLEANREAFAHPKLKLVYDDAKAQLQQADGHFDVIIADLADPVYGGPCYQLYTQDFYRDVVQPKLNPDGIFVTQSGPAGVLSSTEVFTAIHTTLRSVFPAVLPYAQHIPSYNDAWGFNMAVQQASTQLPETPAELDGLIKDRLNSQLKFLDGLTLQAVMTLNKVVRAAVQQEEHIYTVDNPRFIHGSGMKTLSS
ncbi:hypothetical protein ABBQ32_005660 [Trebouxia sp. C0010 RCD-2024]